MNIIFSRKEYYCGRNKKSFGDGIIYDVPYFSLNKRLFYFPEATFVGEIGGWREVVIIIWLTILIFRMH